jgi:hypothetical protein
LIVKLLAVFDLSSAPSKLWHNLCQNFIPTFLPDDGDLLEALQPLENPKGLYAYILHAQATHQLS